MLHVQFFVGVLIGMSIIGGLRSVERPVFESGNDAMTSTDLDALKWVLIRADDIGRRPDRHRTSTTRKMGLLEPETKS